MPTTIENLTRLIQPERTILLFGAGSSLPSGAPSVDDLKRHFEQVFGVSATEYSLAEQTAIIENRTHDRARLIQELRRKISGTQPSGSILNLPLYEWRSIFTTNYDCVIEGSYARKSRPLSVCSSNFEYGKSGRTSDEVQLFKLHGSIEKDISDGHNSQIIITEADYDVTSEYRQSLWDRFKADLGGGHLLVIGHSLGDQDIKDVVERAHQINRTSGGQGKITVFIYTKDEGRADLYERRGIDVCFGGLDDFFAGMAKRIVPSAKAMPSTGDPLDQDPALRPATIDVAHAAENIAPKVSAMFNGWPASHADIAAGLTFRRDVAGMIAGQLTLGTLPIAIVLGPAGVGKTTASRQALAQLRAAGFVCWEHKTDQQLLGHYWRKVGRTLQAANISGCLFIDDAHMELSEINSLVDDLNVDGSVNLRLIISSSKNHWHPRVKTPALHHLSHEYHLNRVSILEIDRLLDLVESVPAIRSLAGQQFTGFSRQERRRRLIERCEQDMFVCLRNIFASEKFDDIVLREFATLPVAAREVYRVVAAMEFAGVRVHRQLVIRLLGIPYGSVEGVLQTLTDIIHEETVNEREGIYAWYGRHNVIMGIVAEHKYYSEESRFDLFDKIISNTYPTYNIELTTLQELCNVETGLATLSKKDDQNILLRKMVSIAPGLRVPRHRLIRNLITLGQFDEADTEIRLFEHDFRLDGPASRYKIEAATNRAQYSPGLLPEDRLVLLQKARELAAPIVNKLDENKAVLGAYAELGLAIFRFSGGATVFDEALARLREAERLTGDSDIPRLISNLERKMVRLHSGMMVEEQVFDVDDPVPTE